MAKPRLILASRSPRRSQLLREAGYEFDVIASPYEDPPQPQAFAHQTPEQLAIDLATHKAAALADTLNEPQRADRLILAADTIALSPDRRNLLGTPTSHEQARDMLHMFCNSAHDVITGVCILQESDQRAFADVATVHLGLLSHDQIETYLDTNEWQGKAGGYNLTDRRAAGWPIEVEGDPTTVVGLPMQRFETVLRDMLSL